MSLENIKRARIAIVSIFGLNGLLLAIWAVYIPVILFSTHTSSTALGLLLLLMGGGAFCGMQAGGHLADKFGSKRLVVVNAIWISFAIIPIGFVNSVGQLAIVLVALGFGSGGLDVSMNLQAAAIEEQYNRPLMSSFHAVFSIGTFLGSGLGALLLAQRLSPSTTFLLFGILGVLITLVATPFMLAGTLLAQDHVPTEGAIHPHLSHKIWIRVLLLGGIAFMLMLSEGVANDWSALQLKRDLGASAAHAALGYAAFSSMMTFGRFTADRIARTFGPVSVVRYGSLIAALGMLIVVTSDMYPLSLIGWGIFGLGLSGCVPQLFTAAGKLSTRNQGVVMSRVVGIGYIGLLAGPAVIGWASLFMSLSNALIIPLVFTVITAVGAKKIMHTKKV
jgi:MFS family permease